MTDTLITPTVDPTLDTTDGDHERFAHIIRKADQMLGYVEGRAVTALCGKTWVPTKDPEKFPICPTCREVWARIQQPGDGDG